MQSSSSPTSHSPAHGIQHPDSPGVRIPPPIFFLTAFFIGFVVQRAFPIPFLPPSIRLGLGGVLALMGALFIVTAIPTMLKGHGTLNTNGPSSQVVTSGPYRFSRNPMYLGLVLLYGGAAVILALVWALLLLIPLVVYTQVRVILPEEQYLTRAFGDTYRDYTAKIRRWI